MVSDDGGPTKGGSEERPVDGLWARATPSAPLSPFPASRQLPGKTQNARLQPLRPLCSSAPSPSSPSLPPLSPLPSPAIRRLPGKTEECPPPPLSAPSPCPPPHLPLFTFPSPHPPCGRYTRPGQSGPSTRTRARGTKGPTAERPQLRARARTGLSFGVWVGCVGYQGGGVSVSGLRGGSVEDGGGFRLRLLPWPLLLRLLPLPCRACRRLVCAP